ncbi:PP2C family protein-serine/threonine phosphatase [Clostridium saccharobutylicum]|uniref:Protein serine/threonine phosphatase n=1 Tax=Clostridium saccharobutylicum DSM 13864 TaxID=1345695 RepID=U5MMJ9_CLOSA|nr:protein phosphatase 2C domain-containing protein [Clostridium saccharobutylicum]AGX41820.1 protein serine/threonine phosphatase [Clostridium saccharobutylicum DSM 13864]AQR89096.1 serine/threonine phosphatase stp [Clostridium saccharobutylicum]AQR98997.1 serine/threonine phosphatase stp [Clostridium saccharobutylicum]AQS08710.1 serine/threonine phosphatase stp [Clostridium saccharobutylicum]AQS12985.1 serine/threonine phosphatase stp [Clostridium saccharobutylicum]
MLYVNNYSSLNLILLLICILIILFIIRSYLLKKLNKKDLKIAKDISIGYEEIQEDYGEVVTTYNGTIAVLADGLGKNEAGRISSMTAVKTIIRMFKEEGNREKIQYFLKKAFNKANREIIKRVERDKGGASVLSVIITDNLLNYALVGDVMLAIFRNKELVRLSKGHSIGEVAQKEYYNGKIQKPEALYAIKEKKLLYYIGQESFKNVEISENPIQLKKNDIVLLMTRGVYEGLRWIEFEEILRKKKFNIDEMCENIMEKIENKNNCNSSIIIMKYSGKKRNC